MSIPYKTQAVTTYIGGKGVDISPSNEIRIGQVVGTTNDVVFNKVTSETIHVAGNVGIGTNTPTKPLDVNGSIKASNLYLGDDGQEPRVDLLFDDHASGTLYDTKIEIGKSDNFEENPLTYDLALGSYGINIKSNNEGLFMGLETYFNSSGNFSPLIRWGDEVSDAPFRISHANGQTWSFNSDGTALFPNNLKIGSGTASEKLDVDGSINFSGTLSVGTTPSKGTSSDVLISNGSDNPVSWRTTVIVGASATASFAGYFTNSGTLDVICNNLEIETVSNSYDTSTGIFTAPRTAHYLFNYYVRLTDFSTADGSQISSASSSLLKRTVGGSFVLYVENTHIDNQYDIKIITPSSHIIIKLETGESIKHQVAVSGVGNINWRGDNHSIRATYHSVNSID